MSSSITSAPERARRMIGLSQDLRYAARMLRMSPGFAAAAVLSLALGIGASTVVFSIADTVFLRPLPYADSQRLVWVSVRFPNAAKTEYLPSPDFVAWRRDNRVFDQLAATGPGSYPMIFSGTQPTEIVAKRVSANFLDTLRVTPILGRSFTLHEELPNGPKAIILTDHLWRTQFAARREILGKSITLDGQPYTVIGILSPSFVFPLEGKLDALTPLSISPAATHHDRAMFVWSAIGRLKPGVTLAQAQANVRVLFESSKADQPRMFAGDARPVVEPLQQHRIGSARLLLFVLTGAVGCLLLIACANVANLLLARWSTRARELAVRAAIGAPRLRLVRQLFTETALLTVLGCTLAIGIVTIALRGFVHFAATEVPRLSEVTLDGRVFAIALLVSVLTTLLFGGLPALRAGRVDIQTVLQGAGRLGLAGGYRVLRRALVAAEVALCLVLLSGAGLLLETLWHMENDHLGFVPEHALAVLVSLKGTSYEKRDHEALANDLLSYARRMPGTEAAALGICAPPVGLYMVTSFARSDRPLPEPFHRGDNIAVCPAGVDYFKALGTPVLKGRTFIDDDFRVPGTLAIINQAAARTYFPGEDPIGKQIGGDREGHWKTIIGIVADAKNQGLTQPAMPEMFVNDLELKTMPYLSFLLRTVGSEHSVVADFKTELHSLDPALFATFTTLNEGISRFTAGTRFNSILLASFAGIAFLMAVIGIYGVLAFAVTQRTQEIGIRMALGAEPHRVFGLVMREGTLLLAIGLAGGLSSALILTRYLKSLLYGVTATDVSTYVVVVLTLSIAALLATFLPARRAASVDPLTALRHE